MNFWANGSSHTVRSAGATQLPMGEEHRHCDGSGSGCRPQHAKPLRTHVEVVGGEDREQRDRSPEQNGEQVEQLGAEKHRLGQQEADAPREVLADGSFLGGSGSARAGSRVSSTLAIPVVTISATTASTFFVCVSI